MIKKTITVLSMLVISAALIWAVWEGNAAAGSKEDFPSGLFASSDLFPKYTLIEITNLEQNTTSRAVIIGNAGADGVLVKVSPDLAAALSIQEGSTVRVRVSVPPLVAEEGADPVLLSKVEDKPSVSPASSEKPEAEASDTVSSEEAPQEETPQEEAQEIHEEEPVQNEPAPPEVSEPVQPVPAEEEKAAEPVIATEAEPVQPETENAPEEETLPIAEVSEPMPPEPEASEATSTVAEVTETAEQPAQSEDFTEYAWPVREVAAITVPEEAAVSHTAETPVREVLPPAEPQPESYTELPVKEVAPIQEPPAEDTEPAADTVETAAIAEAEPGKDTEEPVDEPALIAAEPAAADETVPETEAPIDEAENEAPVEKGEEPQDEPELFASEESLSEEDNTENETVENYAVLVPSEPKEPIAEDLPLPKEPEKPAPPAAPIITQPAEEPYTASTLKKGSFYVQIGQFKDMLNAQSFVQRYGKQYPVAVEKSPAAKGSDVFYKVYIGPLNKDEQGATLETFQKLGFKDAFLKKAP